MVKMIKIGRQCSGDTAVDEAGKIHIDVDALTPEDQGKFKLFDIRMPVSYGPNQTRQVLVLHSDATDAGQLGKYWPSTVAFTASKWSAAFGWNMFPNDDEHTSAADMREVVDVFLGLTKSTLTRCTMRITTAPSHLGNAFHALEEFNNCKGNIEVGVWHKHSKIMVPPHKLAQDIELFAQGYFNQKEKREDAQHHYKEGNRSCIRQFPHLPNKTRGPSGNVINKTEENPMVAL